MIISFTLKNFKSFTSATVPLPPVGFLIGANASGKSNFLEALRFLNALAQGFRLDDMERMIQSGKLEIRGRIQDIFNDACLPLAFSCELSNIKSGWSTLNIDVAMAKGRMSISGEEVTSNYESLPLYQIKSSKIEDYDIVDVEYNNFKRGRNKPLIPCSSQQAIFYQLESPARFDGKDSKSQKEIPTITAEFRENLQKMLFLDPRPALMRNYVYKGDTELQENGSNISSVLANICDDVAKKGKLLEFVRCLPEQDIRDISFIQTERNDVMLRLHESFGGCIQNMDVPLLSDGTLRTLAIAAALLSSPAGTLVVMEEIDNGLHPSRAGMLVKNIMDIAEDNQLQILATTHNPALMNAVPDAELGNVLCCYRSIKSGKSEIKRLEDIKRFPELMATGTLGQIVTDGTLERFLKNGKSDALVREESLRWLEKLDEDLIS